jgi:BirA family biotin operon repressor/biotin-[acetyl-CoA-carboxylase] ligase
MIYRFDTLGSSNDEACKPQYVEGDIILAQCQTAGRGQRGHTWESREGENLTFSLLLEPQFLSPS